MISQGQGGLLVGTTKNVMVVKFLYENFANFLTIFLHSPLVAEEKSICTQT
jgi:hypothetical protein